MNTISRTGDAAETLEHLPSAQHDMRAAYASGGSGVLVSGLAWLVAAGVAELQSAHAAVWALFIGGMAIHPVSVILDKLHGRSGQHRKDNPLAALAMANTAWLICCLPLTYAISTQHVEWFFPAMLLVIGGRYLTFQLVFGMRAYWMLGTALVLSALGLYKLRADPATAAGLGAGIELAFATWILIDDRRWARRGGKQVAMRTDGRDHGA